MAQIKQLCSVTNGQQIVTLSGDQTLRIKRNSIFMVESDLVPYTVAADATFNGQVTSVYLTGIYLGATSAAARGVFATDFTYPDMLPTIAQGDVGTAAVFTAAMYRLQQMIRSLTPGEGGGGGGGASSFAELTDLLTFDLPLTNAPLAAALAGKMNANAQLSEGTAPWLIFNSDLVTFVGTTTFNTEGARAGGRVQWPDGKGGTYTASVYSVAFPGAVDAYTITYEGSPVRTVTQSLVTRDFMGTITNRPTPTIA